VYIPPTKEHIHRRNITFHCPVTSDKNQWSFFFKLSSFYTVYNIQWNLSNATHQGTREMCQIVQDVRTCLIRHTKGPGKCVRLYRMSDYSDFILVTTVIYMENINTCRENVHRNNLNL
jgi:hypothetical protein